MGEALIRCGRVVTWELEGMKLGSSPNWNSSGFATWSELLHLSGLCSPLMESQTVELRDVKGSTTLRFYMPLSVGGHLPPGAVRTVERKPFFSWDS